MSGRRGWVPWILLGIVVAGLLVWAAWPSGETTKAERARAIATAHSAARRVTGPGVIDQTSTQLAVISAAAAAVISGNPPTE